MEYWPQSSESFNRMLEKATSGVLSREASSRTQVRSGGFAPSGLAGGLFEHSIVLSRLFTIAKVYVFQ